MQIIQGKEGGRIIFGKEDFMKGLAPNWLDSAFPIIRGGDQISYSRGLNPFFRYGYAMPGAKPQDATNVSAATAYLRKGLLRGQKAYIISNGALVHEYDASSRVITITGSFPHTITPATGTTPIGNDCVIYSSFTSSVLNSYWWYSYSSTTTWDVGQYDFASGFDDDFMSTIPAQQQLGTVTTNGTTALVGVATKFLSTLQIGDTIIVQGETVRTVATITDDTHLTSTVAFSSSSAGLTYTIFPATGAGYPHPLIVGDDDIMYMGDRNFLHAYDGQVGSNGTFYSRVLTLPAGWIITSMAKSDSGLMIFSYYLTGTANDNFRRESRAWLWNYGELDITRSYNLNDDLTSESFQIGNTIGVFTNGRNLNPLSSGSGAMRSKLQIFNGDQFKPVIAFSGDIPCRGGVEIDGDAIQWNSSGIIHTYGDRTLGDKMGLHRIGYGTGTTSGMLSTFDDAQDVLSVSSGSTTSGALQNFIKSLLQEDSNFLTALAEPEFPLYQKGRIKCVTFEFGNTVTPANALKLNVTFYDRTQSTSCVVLANHNQVTTSNEMMIQRTNDTSGNPLMSFDALALFVQWTSATSTASQAVSLSEVIVDYENYRSITT